jgi:hypothetical protein
VDLPRVDHDILDRVRGCCLALPETTLRSDRWSHAFQVRRNVFAYLLAADDPAGRLATMLVCRADPEERLALLAGGHPYFAPNSGTDRLGVVLDDATDWTEVAELVTESYRLLAPKKLVALLDV